MEPIFKFGKIKNLEIKNRIALPPMVCFSFAGLDGFVSEKNINHYSSIAKGGAGLIIVEATCINKKGRLSNDQLGIWSDKYIDGLKNISEACHDQGAKVFIQIHHAGIRTSKKINGDTATSSDYDDGKTSGRAMTIAEIHDIEEDFINAAIRAEKAGFDGIEIHGAHSYLLTQYFSQKINKREDEYGGSLDNRVRIVGNIVEGIKKNVNKDFVIGIRMGCNENSLEDSINMAKKFENMGIDYLHVSTGFDNTKIIEDLPKDFPCNWIVYGGTKVKENVNIPVISVNSINTPEKARYLLDHELVDFVAIGRSQLADYDFVNHMKDGKEIRKCLGCKPCSWFSNGDNCPRHKK